MQNTTLQKDEIASIKRDIYYLAFQGILRSTDSTLLTRGGSLGLKIYDDLERDPHCFSVLQKRKMAVVAFPWDVEAASTSRLDKKAADIVKAQLTAINFDQLTLNLLDGILKGFAVGEIMWGSDGQQIYVDRIIPRDQRRFVFDDDYKLRLLVPENINRGIELPDRKFIVHSVGAKDGNPYGIGLGNRLFWPVFFKRNGITFWLTFADKYGSPTAVGKYPAGTPENDQDALLEQISQIAQEAGLTIPDTMSVELLEAARTGSADLYEKLCRYMDEQISEAVLGETSTTTGKSSGMNSNQAEVHNEIRLELARADADLLSGVLAKTLVQWIVDYNVPGATPPKVWRQIEQNENLKVRADRDTQIKGLGFKPTLEYITETYGDGWEVDNMPPPVVPTAAGIQAAQDNSATQFAEAGDTFPDQQSIDNAISGLPDSQLAAQMSTILKPVIELIKSNADGQVVLGQLAELYPKMDSSQLQDLLARLIFVTDLWGRLNASAE